MTQLDLAIKAGLMPAAVSHYERGGREPDLRNLRKIAKALAVSADTLLDINGAFVDMLDEERLLVNRYRDLSAEGKRAVLALAGVLSDGHQAVAEGA